MKLKYFAILAAFAALAPTTKAADFSSSIALNINDDGNKTTCYFDYVEGSDSECIFATGDFEWGEITYWGNNPAHNNAWEEMTRWGWKSTDPNNEKGPNVNAWTEEIYLPEYVYDGEKKVKVVGVGDFSFYGGLRFNGNNLGGKDLQGRLIIPKDYTYIGKYAFYPTENGQKYEVIFNNTEPITIGDCAFQNTFIKNIEFNGPIKYFGEHSFENTQIKEVVIDNVDIIASHAFYNTSALVEVTIGDNVRIIGPYAFGHGANFDANASEAEIEKALLDIADGGQQQTMEIYLGKRVEVIDDFAFFRRAFKCLIIPDACWKIGDYAFTGCASGFQKDEGCGIQLGRGIRSIGKFAFYRAKIYDLSIPENLDHIGKGAFSFESSEGEFSDIYFYDPEPDCETIDPDAFFSFRRARNPEDANGDGDWLFKSVKVHVPEGSLDKYLECDAFKRFFGPGTKNSTNPDEFKDQYIPSAKTTLDGVLGYVFMVPGETVDLNDPKVMPQLKGAEFDNWKYEATQSKKFDAIAELEKNDEGKTTGKVKALDYGQTIAYAIKKGVHESVVNCGPYIDEYDEIVGCAVIFVCPTYTVVYDYNNATAGLTTAPQNIRAKVSGVNGEETGEGDSGSDSNTGDGVTGTVADVKTDNATYQHRVVYNSYPKLLVEPVAGITITQVDRAKVDVDENFTDDGAWKSLDDETGKNPQLLDGQDAVTTTSEEAKFIVPLNPVVEDRVLVLSNEKLTTYTTTDVETVEVGNNISVTVNRFTITINGADDKDVVTVTNMNGQTVYTGLSKTLTMKSQGVYIITVGDTAFKALVR